jgi:hypothetical protein
MRLSFFFFLILSISKTFCSFVGNPLTPYLEKGIFFTHDAFSLRLGYIDNHIYNSQYQDKFQSISSTPSYINLQSYEGVFTINFYNLYDIYGTCGTTNFKLDSSIEQNENLCFSGGIKAIIIKYKDFFAGVDAKYFYTKQTPSYIIYNKQIAPLALDYDLQYDEFQGAFSICYNFDPFIPYIGATYLYSRIIPNQTTSALYYPGTTTIVDFTTKEARNKNNWGMVIGVSMISLSTLSLNLEARFIDQNALGFFGNICF